MSLFVAVIPPAHVVEHLRDALTDVRRRVDAPSVSWTSPDRWHLTLAFLGEPGSRSARIDPIAAEHLLPLQGLPCAGDARLTSAGAFGRQVVWIGLEDGSAKDDLALIAGRISGLVGGTGLAPDRRPWQPHLTIARLRSGSPDALVSALSTYRGPTWNAEAVHLIRSTGGPHPVHECLQSYPLV